MTTASCPACGANAFVADEKGGGTCSRCGYASGEANRCPHCNAVARVEGAGRNTVCGICGGPRIPSNLGGEAATKALREQKRAISNARAASVSTMVQAIFAALVAVVALGLAPASVFGKVLAFAFTVTPLFLALRSRSQATSARALAREAGDRAWHAAAEDAAARASEGVTAEGLGRALGIETSEADRLLTRLAVHERTRIDVGDDAEVRYSVVPEPDGSEDPERKGRA